MGVDLIDGEVRSSEEGPLRVGGRVAVACLEQPVGPAHAIDLEKVRQIAAAAWPEILIKRARSLLIGAHTRRIAARAGPRDVTTADKVRGRGWPAIILGTAVEQGTGNLSRDATGLRGPVVELCDLQITVAVDSRQWCRAADLRLERPVVIKDAPDPLVVAKDQSGQARGRVDHRGDAVVIGPARVERNPFNARAVVPKALVVGNGNKGAALERIPGTADQIDIRCGDAFRVIVTHGRRRGAEVDRTAVNGMNRSRGSGSGRPRSC